MATAALPAIISLLSALGPHIFDAFKSSTTQPGEIEGYNRVSTFDPQQQQLFSQQAQGLGGIQPQIMDYLKKLLSPEGGEEFAAPYMRQFHEQTIPKLAEQFAGVGALSSSGFQQALGQAGAGLSENLAALREGQKGQGVSSIMQMLQGLLGQQTQAFLPKQQSGFQQFLTGIAPGLGQGLAQFGLSKLG